MRLAERRSLPANSLVEVLRKPMTLTRKRENTRIDPMDRSVGFRS